MRKRFRESPLAFMLTEGGRRQKGLCRPSRLVCRLGCGTQRVNARATPHSRPVARRLACIGACATIWPLFFALRRAPSAHGWLPDWAPAMLIRVSGDRRLRRQPRFLRALVEEVAAADSWRKPMPANNRRGMALTGAGLPRAGRSLWLSRLLEERAEANGTTTEESS